jgi:hypothetical protein
MTSPSQPRHSRKLPWSDDADSAGDLWSERNFQIPASLYYEVKVAASVSVISDTVTTMRTITHLIQDPPLESYLLGVGLSRESWVAMQVDGFLVSLISVSDHCVAAVNQVALLGIAPRHCNLNSVVTNDWVSTTPVADALRGVDKFVQPYKPLRNKLVHAGASAGDVGFLLRMFEFAKRNGLKVVNRATGESQFEVLRNRLVAMMSELTGDCEKQVLALLDALIPTYEGQSTFRENEPPPNSH